MKLLLFTGFLGSGKTTLILALARRAAARGARLAIIVNEVGEVGIDGQVFRLGELEVVEITAGCICCQIGADLVRALRELAETFGPELVIVEASGIATPGGVLDAVRRYPPPGLDGIETVTVVDPTRFEVLHEVLTPLIEAQLAEADRVIITRLDEATPAEVEAARAAVARLAPAARLHLVEACREETLEGVVAELLAVLSSGRSTPAAPEEGWR